MITNLKELYIHQIEDLYSAESQIIAALPAMVSKAQDTDLKTALQDHLQESRHQKDRLEEIFVNHGLPPKKDRCYAAEGIIKEAEHLISELSGDVVDAGIVAAAQRFEHYEIAAYGTAKEYANELGFSEDVDLLDESLDEESSANKKLNSLAVGKFLGAAKGLNEAAVV